MLPDRVSNSGPLTYESGALPIALRGPAGLLRNNVVRSTDRPDMATAIYRGREANKTTILLYIYCICLRASWKNGLTQMSNE